MELEKNLGGHPLKFKSVEEMQFKINDYFKVCDETKTPYLITGLAIALGFTSREALLNYEKKKGYERFFDTIKNAKLKCHNYAEGKLFTANQVAGTIFNLKNNYGWKDKQEIEHTGDGPVQVIIKQGSPRQMKDVTPVPKKIEDKDDK